MRVVTGPRIPEFTEADIQHHLNIIDEVRTWAQPFCKTNELNLKGRHIACLLEASLKPSTAGAHKQNGTSRQLTGRGINMYVGPGTKSCDLIQGISELYQASQGEPFTVRRAYIINPDPNGLRSLPCADCQDWFIGHPGLQPDTVLIQDYQDPTTGERVLEVMDFEQLLPVHLGERPVFDVEANPSTLPIIYSPAAQSMMTAMRQANIHITKADIIATTQEAQLAWQENVNSGLVDKHSVPVGVALWPVEPDAPINERRSGRIDWTTTVGVAPEARLVANRLESLKRQSGANTVSKSNPSSIDGIHLLAYWGGLPAPSALGNMVRHHVDLSHLIIATQENGTIQVRTVDDFFPNRYETPPKKMITFS